MQLRSGFPKRTPLLSTAAQRSAPAGTGAGAETQVPAQKAVSGVCFASAPTGRVCHTTPIVLPAVLLRASRERTGAVTGTPAAPSPFLALFPHIASENLVAFWSRSHEHHSKLLPQRDRPLYSKPLSLCEIPIDDADVSRLASRSRVPAYHQGQQPYSSCNPFISCPVVICPLRAATGVTYGLLW